ATTERTLRLLYLPRPTARMVSVDAVVIVIVFMASLRPWTVGIWETQELSDYHFPHGLHRFFRPRGVLRWHTSSVNTTWDSSGGTSSSWHASSPWPALTQLLARCRTGSSWC